MIGESLDLNFGCNGIFRVGQDKKKGIFRVSVNSMNRNSTGKSILEHRLCGMSGLKVDWGKFGFEFWV